MVDPPTYRTEPDPAFADRLERVLLQRLTAPAGFRSRRGVAQSDAPVRTDPDPDDQGGDIIALETHDRPTEPVTPHRRSPGRWLLVAAAVAVVAVVSTLLVAAGSDEDEDRLDTATSTPTTAPLPAQDVIAVPGATEGFPDLEPGRYFIDPDGDDTTPLRVTYQVASEGWKAWLGALKFAGNGATMLTISTMTNVVTDGCSRGDHTPLDPPVGPTVDDLATALSQLAPFVVAAPPTDVRLFGYPGKHLELMVRGDQKMTGAGGIVAGPWARGDGMTDDGLYVRDFGGHGFFADCWDGELHSWFAPNYGERSFSGYHWPGQTEEFWILDVEGTRLVLVKYDSPGSPAEDIAERDAIFDTIRIEP